MYESLDAETRTKLANLLQDRIEYNELINEVMRRKIQILMHPTADAERDLAEYTSAVVAPKRAKITQQQAELLKEAVDIDQIKGLVPMALLGLSQSINFPLLFTALGLDPDMVAEGVDLVKDYFSDNTDL